MSTAASSLDLHDTRALLGFLTGSQTDPTALALDPGDHPALARRLIDWELAPLAQARLAALAPELARHLQADRYSVLAHNALHWQNLARIDAAFAKKHLGAVLLKGAALAGTVYDEPAQRPMSDVDLWVSNEGLGAACETMNALGFQAGQSAARPLALQAMADGEVQFFDGDQPAIMVELHLSPFPGWWLQRTANIDTRAVWERREPLPGWRTFYQLAPEDMVIHLAVHMAINHQFGLAAVRSLVDIALTVQVRDVNWDIVVRRAQEWRVATAVWLVLSLLQDLFELPDLAAPLRELQPPAWRRRSLQQIVSPASVVAGMDIRHGRERFWLLLLLVDRPGDAIRLVYRTVWPEPAWLAARYGRPTGHWHHLRQIMRDGGV